MNKFIKLKSENNMVELWNSSFSDWAVFSYNLCIECRRLGYGNLSDKCFMYEKKSWSIEDCKSIQKMLFNVLHVSEYDWPEPEFSNFTSSLQYCLEAKQKVLFEFEN